MGPVKNPNCKFTFVQLVKLLILFPFFSVKTAADYADSALGELFACKKDTFYRLMDDGRIDWRRLVHSINRQLIGLISRRADAKGATCCLILDDTDLPKRGNKAEGLGKVFAHTVMRCILGFKSMFLCYTDGKTILFHLLFSRGASRFQGFLRIFQRTDMVIVQRKNARQMLLNQT